MQLVLRWVGAGLVGAERRFHRVKGHEEIRQLVAALASLKNSKDVA